MMHLHRSLARVVRASFLGLVLSACAASGPGGGATPCVSDGECPSGQICINERCGEPGRRDAGAAQDGGVVALDGGPAQDGGAPDGGAALDGGSPQDGGGVDDGGAQDGGVIDAGGVFGGPCTTNGDCQSLICIQTSAGGVCTKPCSQDCPIEWGCRIVLTTPVCVPPELAKCATCTADSECGGQYRCSSYGDARVCLRACTVGGSGECGAAEVCRGVDADAGATTFDGGTAGKCVPADDPKNCGSCGNECGVGATCCNDRCVDLRTDETLCGMTCAAALACVGVERCCGGSCVDVATSDTHCGACLGEGGATCSGADARCCAGNCVTVRDNPLHCGSCAACSGGQACCGTQCADLTNDPTHCGACTGASSTCDPGAACCSSACAALTNNDQHCGACANNCATVIGTNGKCCGPTCVDKLTNKTACGDTCATCSGTTPECCGGACKDLATDSANCGMCGRPVPGGQSCCGGAFRDLQNDAANCGVCGFACGAGQTCCAGQCKSLQIDAQNCGVCGRRCGTDVVLDNVMAYGCAMGSCTIAQCAAAFHNVDSDTATGCECREDGYEPTGFVSNNQTSGHNWNATGVSDSGYSVTFDANLVPAGDSDFYWVHIADETFSDFHLIANLTNIPAGTNYDLYLYRWNGSSWEQRASSTNAGNASESIDYDPDFNDDEGDYGLEVRYVSGPLTCAKYHLEWHDD